MPTRLAPLALASLLVLLVAPAHADYPHDAGSGGLPVTAVAGDQQSPSMCSDGAGGSIVVWNDSRNAATNSYDIYAQRIDRWGRPKWSPDGVPVCTDAASQNLPLAVSDGAGGVVLVWQDQRSSGGGPGIYAQRLNASGVAQWTANGIRAFSQPTVNYEHAVTSDGAGGLFLAAHRDTVSGFTTRQLFVQRILATGALPWGASGALVRSGNFSTPTPSIVADDVGGAIVAYRASGFLSQSDVVMQKYNFIGAPMWGPSGVIVSETSRFQALPRVATDGAGGAFVGFEDSDGGYLSIFGNHVDSQGRVLWGQNGIMVAPYGATPAQSSVRVASDGVGGALFAFNDNRGPGPGIYAQRMGPTGALMWGASGLVLCALSNTRLVQSVVGDGTGGMIAFWVDARSTFSFDVYAQRVTAAGQPVWTPNGLPLTTSPLGDDRVSAIPDGEGGAFVAWDAASHALGFDLVAQRVDTWGYLGTNEPAITSVRDVANDQGGRVKVAWDASWLDANLFGTVQLYRVWRSVPTSGPFAAAAAARGIATSSDDAVATRRWLADPDGALDYAWELVGSQAAAQLPAYSFVAPTGGDSVAGSFPRTVFRVEAVAYLGSTSPHWWSAPDSGYSVDDLAPAAPAAFAGVYVSGTSSLSWNPNGEPDLAGYRLHRGSSIGFVPSPVNRVASPVGTSWVDSPGSAFVYKLLAVDVHGNTSPVATWFPAALLDAPSPTAAGFAFAPPSPNPARGATTLRFVLPAAGRVRLALYDASGRIVRTVRDGELAAGEHAARLELTDDAGRTLAPGLYLARLSGPDGERTRRIVAVR